MKKLKKLKLKKDTVVSLSDYEMKTVQGGSSWPCAVASATVSIVYYETKDASWWNCPYSNQKDCMSAVSQKWVWYGNERTCEIPEVEIYGYYGR